MSLYSVLSITIQCKQWCYTVYKGSLDDVHSVTISVYMQCHYTVYTVSEYNELYNNYGKLPISLLYTLMIWSC